MSKYVEYGFYSGQECWIIEADGKELPYDEYYYWYDQRKEEYFYRLNTNSPVSIPLPPD
jgi:hypothetical protein